MAEEEVRGAISDYVTWRGEIIVSCNLYLRQWRRKGRELRLKKIRIRCDLWRGISEKIRKNVTGEICKTTEPRVQLEICHL